MSVRVACPVRRATLRVTRAFAGAAVASLMIATLCTAPAYAEAEADARVDELERKVEVLLEEIENMKLGAVADTAAFASRLGFGPAASKVYGARLGLSIGGYGEMLFEKFDRLREDEALSAKPARLDFLRQIVYVGYKFSDDLLFNSEIEIEHAGVLDEAAVEVDPASGEGEAELSGEVVVEFAYVEWAPRSAFGVRAGMMLVPLGLVNELHEPTVFVGARRPDVERNIIPTTWRGNGIGVFGELASGLAYRAYLIEGLDASRFSASSGVRGGRQSGSRSLATHPAFAARVDYAGVAGFVIGASGYIGNAWQGAQPASGRLSPTVAILDAHARWHWRGLAASALYVSGTLDRAGELSTALGLVGTQRLGERFHGHYLDAAYDVMPHMAGGSRVRVLPYARYEAYDTQDDVPGGAESPANERTIWTAGVALQPHPNVVVKVDRQIRRNQAETETHQWNAALGYMF